MRSDPRRLTARHGPVQYMTHRVTRPWPGEGTMILIEITNIHEIVRRERGLIAAKLGPYVRDVEGEVEQSVIAELKAAFAARGIEANIVSMRGAKLRSTESSPPPPPG